MLKHTLHKQVTRISNSVKETEAVAAEVAQSLKGGECIALDGELGAGKTQFVRGLVTALGGDPHSVSSPTYVLLNIYDRGRLKVFHLDAYRVGGADDFEAIGFAELLEQRGVVVVEWAERVKDLLPKPLIRVKIEAVGEHRRRIELLGINSREDASGD